MASRALANILGGVMSGVAGSMKDRRLKREEEESWQKEKGRKREMFDMQDEYGQRREDRQRQQRKTDEQEMYDLGQTRLQQLQKQQLDKIAKLYPDRWQDPKYQQEATALVMGIKLPPMPADKKIASLIQSGKIDEALSAAAQSSNPEDMKFYQEMITAITQRKELDMLLNPAKYQQPTLGSIARPDSAFVQGALDQGRSMATDMPAIGSSILSAFMPANIGSRIEDSGGSIGGIGAGNVPAMMRGSAGRPQTAPADMKAEKARLKELVSQQQNIVKDLASRKDDYTLSATQKSAIEKEYNNAVDRMRLYQQQYMSLLEGVSQPSIGGRSLADIANDINAI